MKTFAEISAWCAGAAAEFGDPSVPVCQIFARWSERPPVAEEACCGWHDGELVVRLGPEFRLLQMPLTVGGYSLDDSGALQAYGSQLITAGVWAIAPSLLVEGAIHAFLTLYDVPNPAPWERRIILP